MWFCLSRIFLSILRIDLRWKVWYWFYYNAKQIFECVHSTIMLLLFPFVQGDSLYDDLLWSLLLWAHFFGCNKYDAFLIFLFWGSLDWILIQCCLPVLWLLVYFNQYKDDFPRKPSPVRQHNIVNKRCVSSSINQYNKKLHGNCHWFFAHMCLMAGKFALLCIIDISLKLCWQWHYAH